MCWADIMGKYKKVQEISLYPEQTMATAIFQPVTTK